jgi:hypothetical protein
MPPLRPNGIKSGSPSPSTLERLIALLRAKGPGRHMLATVLDESQGDASSTNIEAVVPSVESGAPVCLKSFNRLCGSQGPVSKFELRPDARFASPSFVQDLKIALRPEEYFYSMTDVFPDYPCGLEIKDELDKLLSHLS